MGRDGRWTSHLHAVLLIAAATVLAACTAPLPSGLASPSGTPLAPSGTPPASSVTAPAAASTPQVTITPPSPSIPPSATPTALSPTNGTTVGIVAEQTVSTYVGNLVAGRYKRAWNQLSAQSQQRWGSLDAFAAERSAFIGSAGKRFSISDPDNSQAALAQWLPQDFDGARDLAYVVTVKYPPLAGSNAGHEVYIAAPVADDDATWQIWAAR